MTDETIAKLAAQALQARRESELSPQERDLSKALVEGGYLRQPSRGFLGTITSKAMLRHQLYRMREPVFVSMKRGSERYTGLNLE